MKIELKKQDLVRQINIALKAVPNKASMDILQCIAINALEDEIKFTTNNLELGIEIIMKGKVIEPGSIAINAKILSDIIRKLPDDLVVISTDINLKTTIQSGEVEFSLTCRSAESFPILPVIVPENEVSLSQSTLKEMIQQTAFSISENQNRIIMTGELLEIYDNYLRLVSMDGYRLSERKIKLKQDCKNVKIIIPGKSLIEIGKILSDDLEDSVIIQVTQKHILFQFESTKIVTRLIDGDFFTVNKMITNEYSTKISVHKQVLLESIDRAILLVAENEKSPIILNVEGEMLKINADSAIGSLNEKISIYKEGKDVRIGFNPKYLYEVLRAIDEERIELYFNSSRTPCIIRDQEETYIYLVSPVALIDEKLF